MTTSVSRVRKARLPAWVKQRIRAKPDNELGLTFKGATWWMHGMRPHWFDHWGTGSAADGSDVLVVEPYDVGSDELRGMLRLADEIGAEVRILPVSTHFPGHTIRVEFWDMSPKVS